VVNRDGARVDIHPVGAQGRSGITPAHKNYNSLFTCPLPKGRALEAAAAALVVVSSSS